MQGLEITPQIICDITNGNITQFSLLMWMIVEPRPGTFLLALQ
jgi:hypothetical protein